MNYLLKNPLSTLRKTVLCLMLSLGVAQTSAIAALPAEMTGTREVMAVIRHANIAWNERLMLQNVQDILDFKGQLYSQDSLLAPTASSQAESDKGMPPARYRFPYHR